MAAERSEPCDRSDMSGSGRAALYLGVDLGTTAVKAGLYDDEGRVLAEERREFSLDVPAPGFVEFDADEYLACAFEVMRAVVASGAGGREVRAMGLSSQGQTFVLLGDEGRPLRPAVSWLDVRADEEARELSGVAGRLGLGPITAIASAPKLLWLARHEQPVVARARRLLLIPDYLVFRLTGRDASDPVTAKSSGLYDWRSGRWVEPLVEACGLSRVSLPQVLDPGEPAGRLTPQAAKEIGLSQEVQVAIGSNDQCTGALGAGNVAPGCASLTLGTALALIVTAEHTVEPPPGVEAAPHPAGAGLLVLLAYAKTAGIVLRWFRDVFAPARSYDELLREAAGAPIGAGGLVCIPHFSGLATPSFNPAVRGAFVGLTLAHGRGHMLRALVESLSFAVRENLELLAPAAGGAKVLRAIGGGARSDLWLQTIADVTGLHVERAATQEAACLGAAELAMVAAGRYDSVAAAAVKLYRPERLFQPEPKHKSVYDQAFARYTRLLGTLYPPEPR